MRGLRAKHIKRTGTMARKTVTASRNVAIVERIEGGDTKVRDMLEDLRALIVHWTRRSYSSPLARSPRLPRPSG
jgi:hypothetical protein